MRFNPLVRSTPATVDAVTQETTDIQYSSAPSTEWTPHLTCGDTPAMARYRHNVYASANTPRYVVLFDLQWQVIECQRLEPSSDLRNAMITAIDRLTCDGWILEGTLNFGFVFLNRKGIRRLLILTERDPYDHRPQTFSPFK